MDIDQKKVILITGAASGLGEATARYLAKRGAQVILLDKNIIAAQSIANEIQGAAFECDVTSADSVQNILNQIISTHHAIHALINCAGVVLGARLVGKQGAMPLIDFQRVIEINLIGTFNVMRLVAEKMMAQKPVNSIGERGVIINTASIAAFEGQLGQVAYSASKGGVHAMTLPAARELAQFGVRVLCIAPGVMQTPMMQSLSKSVQESLSADIPFPKQLGDPQYFATLVGHMIENSYLNGETVRLDGALRLS